MLFLIIGLVALLLGPALHRLAVSRPFALAALDSFTFIAIGGLILLNILPESLHNGGWVAGLAAFAGLIGPGLAERLVHRAAERVHLLFIAVAMIGLGVHSFVDGLALAEPSPSGHGGASLLALAVIIHQLPVGLTVWWLLLKPYGARVAWGTLIYMAATTVAGFFLGGALLAEQAERFLAAVTAFVGGSLVHVVLHQPHELTKGKVARRGIPSALGAAVAVALLTGLLVSHHEESAPLPLALTGLVLFLGFVVLRYGPASWLDRLLPHSHSHARGCCGQHEHGPCCDHEEHDHDEHGHCVAHDHR